MSSQRKRAWELESIKKILMFEVNNFANYTSKTSVQVKPRKQDKFVPLVV